METSHGPLSGWFDPAQCRQIFPCHFEGLGCFHVAVFFRFLRLVICPCPLGFFFAPLYGRPYSRPPPLNIFPARVFSQPWPFCPFFRFVVPCFEHSPLVFAPSKFFLLFSGGRIPLFRLLGAGFEPLGSSVSDGRFSPFCGVWHPSPRFVDSC